MSSPADRSAVTREAPEALPKSDVTLSQDQIIALLAQLSAGQAMDSVRQRFNMALGLLATLVALAGAGAGIVFYAMLDRIIDPKVSTQVAIDLEERLPPRVESEVERLLGERVATELSVLLDRDLPARTQTLVGPMVERQIEDRLDAASLIPLLVAEATSFELRDGYSDDDGERVLDALGQLAPTILSLEGLNRELALRRLEDIIDAFIDQGDYYRAHRTYATFGAPLLQYEGILQSVGLMLMSERIIHGVLPEHLAGLSAEFLTVPASPGGFGLEFQHLHRLLAKVEAANWKPAVARREALVAVQRFEDFADWSYEALSTLDQEIGPDGRHHTADGARRLDGLKGAMAEVMSRSD